jgi:NADPH-dependent glutamate synthase beta subunit-like oxidoreductase
MEAMDYESVISRGKIPQVPISLTTTEVNITGNWRIFKPLLELGVGPCSIKCPLKIKIPDYVYKMANDNVDEALNLLREYNPIPAILGRVCPHFCMVDCNRSLIDDPLHIGYIEQYLGDIGLSVPYTKPYLDENVRVAIVGSGPAGLGAAYFLRRHGVKVTIYEKEENIGGLLRYGIPAYRLPRDILDAELNNLFTSLKINLIVNHMIKSDDVPSLLKEHEYIFFAPGLAESIVPSYLHESKRVIKGLELLSMINKGYTIPGKSFAVIGGGNVAVDVARSLLRLGKKVEVLYRRTFTEMPAYEEEKSEMLKEGVLLREKTLAGEVNEKNSRLDIVLHKAISDNGNIVAGEAYGNLEVDYLILAIGQKKGVSLSESDNVLMGGDYLIGASSVAESIATGKEGAYRILKAINKEKINVPFEDVFTGRIITRENVHLDYIKKSKAVKPIEAPISDRIKSFTPIYQPIDKKIAEQELERCINCGICDGCGLCWFFCPDNAISLQPEGEHFKVKILLEHCKGCGICSQVCPRGIINMLEDK